MKAKTLINDYIAARPDEAAFLRTEFDDLGGKSRSAIDRAIAALIREGKLVRGGWGILVRARYNALGASRGRPFSPCSPVCEWGIEALRKLGVENPDKSEGYKAVLKEYLAGESTQIPIRGETMIGKSRISRKIGYNKAFLELKRGLR